MCRLFGAALFQDKEYNRDYSSLFARLVSMMITGELLNGGDGVGLAITQKNQETSTLKSSKKVYDAIYSSGKYRYVGAIRTMKKELDETMIIQGHVRKATNGSSKNDKNLHPFRKGDIIGCHNGVVANYRDLWATNEVGEAEGDNDSEVIFALLNKFEPTLTDPKEIANVVSEIYGSLAISAVSSRSPYQLMLVSRERSLYYWVDEEQGIFWYASSAEMLAYAGIMPLKEAKKMQEEGIFVSLLDTSVSTFSVQSPPKEVPYYRPYADRSKTICMFCQNTREVATTAISGMSDMKMDHWVKNNMLYVRDGDVMVRCPACTPDRTYKGGARKK